MAPFPCFVIGLTHTEFLTGNPSSREEMKCSLCKAAHGSAFGVLSSSSVSWIQAGRALNLVFHSQANTQITTQLHNRPREATVALSHFTGVSRTLWAIGPLRTAGLLLQLQLKSLSSEGEEKTGAALCLGVSSWLTLGSFLMSTQRICYLYWGAHYSVHCLHVSTALWTTFWSPENLLVATLDL